MSEIFVDKRESNIYFSKDYYYIQCDGDNNMSLESPILVYIFPFVTRGLLNKTHLNIKNQKLMAVSYDITNNKRRIAMRNNLPP